MLLRTSCSLHLQNSASNGFSASTLSHGPCNAIPVSSSSRGSEKASAWSINQKCCGFLVSRKLPYFKKPSPVLGASAGHFDDTENDKISENHTMKHTTINEKENTKEGIMVKLRRYGLAGVLSYGLLNTLYYLVMFLFAWFYISPAPSGLGYRAAAERFLKLFALVWAGSQITKLPRAACALTVAPAIDKGLTWFTHKSKLKSRSQAFGVIVACCFGLALLIFVVITFLWA